LGSVPVPDLNTITPSKLIKHNIFFQFQTKLYKTTQKHINNLINFMTTLILQNNK